MDETTYSTRDVIDTINRRFVPVRVDNDQRPDINARYNQGGWPTTAILTPDGDLLKGATYVPPDQMHTLLTQIDAFYGDPEKRLAIAQHVRETKARRGADRTGAPGAIKPDVPDRVFSFLDANFDERYGGFGTDQKFPQTGALHFLLDRWARTRDERSKEMVQRTLHAMAGGGMYDRVHGGFYRYSTTRDFSVPHFEKMLEDLGGLIYACARAHAMFGDAELGRIAIEVRSYLDARLWNDRFAGYGGSQDADEDYYRLDAAGRAASHEPYVDPTIYVSWNAETARALVASGPLLEASGADAGEWTARGLAILESLWSRLLVDGLMCRFFDGAPHVRGLLADQAWASWAALYAFEATGDTLWLRRTMEVVDAADVLFDRNAACYADRLRADGDQGRLVEPAFPLDDNALMARVLVKLAAMTGDVSRSKRARTILESSADSYRAHGMFAAGYGSAALDLLSPPLDVIVVGGTNSQRTVALREVVRRVASPPIHIDVIDPATDAHRLVALGHEAAEQPVAYVCSARECFVRTTEPHELASSLSQSALAART